MAAPIYIPINIVGGSLFPTSLPIFVICVLFDGRDDQFLLYLMKQSGYSSDFWSEDSYFYLQPNNFLRVVFCFTLTSLTCQFCLVCHCQWPLMASFIIQTQNTNMSLPTRGSRQREDCDVGATDV